MLIAMLGAGCWVLRGTALAVAVAVAVANGAGRMRYTVGYG